MRTEMHQAEPSTTPSWLPVRRAAEDEAEAIASLVNTACAHEADFAPATRTSTDEIRGLLDRGDFLVIEDHAAGRLAAAVFVAQQDGRGELALLAVAPDVAPTFATENLRNRLIAIAEALFEADGCTSIELSVANLRTELPPLYRSLGYRDAGTVPFRGAQSPRQPCHLIRMTKELH